jgi:hypothetical protein
MGTFNDAFERQKKLSIYWYNKASDLHGAAGALWSSMLRPDGDAVAEGLGFPQGFKFGIACHPVYHMLCGMALELLLKAILVARGEEPKAIHNLVALTESAGIPLTNTQAGLLRILSESIIWAGRYPVPKQEQHYHQFVQLHYDHLYDPVPTDSKIKLRRPNGNLDWTSFSELWALVSEVYGHHS